jgi:arsenate reductase
MIELYGIPNCNQVKNARTWLDAHGMPYVFHDFKKSSISNEQIQTWLRDVAWDSLVNRKGTTWRALSDERKAAIQDAQSATALMIESPSIIKRPVLVTGNITHVGFSDALYQQIFQK